jgi:chemotaxis regulatin CheY-phosphate phosphatase CheZ
MSTRPVRESLYDSEAALRQVNTALEDMTGEVMPDEAPAPGTPTNLADFVSLVVQGYSELNRVLVSLKQSRDALERSSVEKLQHTHDKLKEVSAATEVAATDILNGLERASVMVDELDAAATGEPADSPAPGIRNNLRDELFALMGHMQFQDITSQQLSYASAVLTEMEARVTRLVGILHPAVSEIVGNQLQAPVAGVTWDPDATLMRREDRQAVADEIVASQGSTRS